MKDLCVTTAEYIDTHAHLSRQQDMETVDDIISRATEARVVGIMDISTSIPELSFAINMRHAFAKRIRIGVAAAITPADVVNRQNMDLWEQMLRDVDKLDAIGETGLDARFFDEGGLSTQQEWCEKHLLLAKSANKPAIVHCVNAFEEITTIVKKVGLVNLGAGVCHCFVGNIADAKKFLDCGWFLSLSGILTFKNAGELRDTVKYIPLNRIVLETDMPFLAPAPFRGKVNEPAYIAYTAICLADILDMDVFALSNVLRKNTEALFNL